MASEIKALIVSDMHIGLKPGELVTTDEMRMSTFKKVITLAEKHDLLLISGDLVHGSSVNRDLSVIIQDEFKRLRNCNTEIIYTPGMAELDDQYNIPDWLISASPTQLFYQTNRTAPFCFEKDGQKIYIYGTPPAKNNRISGIQRSAINGFHIGLFHAAYESAQTTESVLPSVNKNDLVKMNLDFYALGGIHNFRIFKIQNRIVCAYPGSSEAVSFQETGDRYVISITISDNSIARMQRQSVNTISVKDITVDCRETPSLAGVQRLIEENSGKTTSMRLTCTGFRNYDLLIGELDRFRDSFYQLIINDRTVPALDLLCSKYRDEQTIRGEFFRTLNTDYETDSLPDQLSIDSLQRTIYYILQNGFGNSEEWLCNLLNA